MSEVQNKFEGISFKPSDIVIPAKYVILEYCGKSEGEEVMARIITKLKEANKWGCVRSVDLMQMLKDDLQAFDQAASVQHENATLKAKYQREHRRISNRIKSWWSGVEVVPEPTYAKVPETPEHTFLSAGPEFGVRSIYIGLQHLLNNGYLEGHVENGKYTDFTPTQKALLRFQEMNLVTGGGE